MPITPQQSASLTTALNNIKAGFNNLPGQAGTYQNVGSYTPPSSGGNSGYGTTNVHPPGYTGLSWGQMEALGINPSTGQSINAGNIGTQPMNLPPPPTAPNYSGTIAGGNAGLANLLASGGYTLNAQGQYVYTAPKETPAPTPTETSYLDKAKEIMGLYKPPVSTADLYTQALQETGVQAKRQAVQSYTNQLNAITAKSQADQLSLTGQGRGVPEVIIGGQQAQVSKEAAIQALPITAQLSAAQGDLQLAESHLDTLFKIKVSDAEAQTNYWNKIVDINWDVFKTSEQNKLTAIKEQRATATASMRDAVNNTQQLALKALEYNNQSAFSSLTSLVPPDPASRTFNQDLTNYNKQVALYAGKLQSPSAGIDLQLKQAELAGKKASTAKIYAEINASAQTGTPLGDSLYTQLKTRSISFTELPADQKKLALKVFADKGETIPRTLTAKEKDAADNATSGLDAVQQLRTLANTGLPLTREFIFGQGTGVRGAVGRFLGTSNFINLANEATDIKTRIRTGAALNNQEIEFYKTQRPIYGDKPEDIQKKLANLEGFYLGMSGLPVTITAPDGSQSAQFEDLFNAKQRLGLRQAIAAGWTLTY